MKLLKAIEEIISQLQKEQNTVKQGLLLDYTL